MLCKNCGTEGGNAKFCPNCGTPLIQTNDQFQNQQVPQPQATMQFQPNTPTKPKKNTVGTIGLIFSIVGIIFAFWVERRVRNELLKNTIMSVLFLPRF